MKILSRYQERFCQEIVRGNEPNVAYKNSFPYETLTDLQVSRQAKKLLNKEYILTRIGEIKFEVSKLAMFDGQKLVQEWVKIASGDANELCQYQVQGCPNCFAQNEDFENEGKNENVPKNNNKHFYSDPNCSTCHGQGIGRVVINDTRFLSETGRALYDGVEMTKYGPRIKLRDRDSALLNLARYFKIVDGDQKDNGKLEITIKGGLPD